MDDQDFRAERMESREGLGLALERRQRWEENIPQDVRDLASPGSDRSLEAWLGKERAAEFRKQQQEEAKEQADLIGFWVAWHMAGGFSALESGGWNRATLFRKVKQFRTVFGSHPDEYEFQFIELDPHKVWMSEFLDAL